MTTYLLYLCYCLFLTQLKVIGQLEINSNNNEEIQREAAKVRKHRLLRALAKQYLN